MPKTFKRPEWFPDWRGQIVVVVAAGPSASGMDYEPYKGRAKFIAINMSYKLVPWADVLLGADAGWWNQHKGVKDFPGIKVTLDFSASRAMGLELLRLDKLTYGFSLDKPGYVGMGCNSGFYGINLALQFADKKPKGIIACGFDMNDERGIHWHGVHPRGLNNPGKVQFRKWAPLLDKQSKFLDQLGVRMINTSMHSSLKNFPRMPIDKAFASMEGAGHG